MTRKKISSILFSFLLLGTLLSCQNKEETEDKKETNPTAQEAKSSCPECSSFQHDGIERSYILHLPKNLKSNSPLVFMLHGYGSSGEILNELGYMNTIADEYGFGVVYPQGTKTPDGARFWDAGLTVADVDDIGYVTELAKFLQKEHGFDTSKTFISGTSNGGFMSYKTIIEKPDVFKAAASIIGTMSGETWENRVNAVPVPIMQLSGKMDEVIPITGVVNMENGMEGAPDMETVMKFWADLNKCTEKEAVQVTDNTTAYLHKNGVNGNEVWYYVVDDLAHDVPFGKNGNVNSFQVVWDFFSKY